LLESRWLNRMDFSGYRSNILCFIPRRRITVYKHRNKWRDWEWTNFVHSPRRLKMNSKTGMSIPPAKDRWPALLRKTTNSLPDESNRLVENHVLWSQISRQKLHPQANDATFTI
jgi:hypothetical protein